MPQGTGTYPVGPWRMEVLPSSSAKCVFDWPGAALEVWLLLALLSSLPGSSKGLRPQQHSSPWRCSWLANARSLQNSLKERGSPPRSVALTNPLVKGGDRLVSVCLLVCSRARAPTRGGSDTDGGATPPPAAWSSTRRLLWGKNRARAGSESLGRQIAVFFEVFCGLRNTL